ncbi:protein toll [Scaptodrosophila lebanonensis]|uniref:Protein toll n=1 Tax=Drosophila lebanonensis TaxID=7225 RepID=A0A6J2T3H9_DROLE|nr:protein toll [Scaptodrosophila lebanonensis]XP_030369791.1 protein toll [Scaptodrosophila lebanonensis]
MLAKVAAPTLLRLLLQLICLHMSIAAFGRDECNELNGNSFCLCSRSMSEYEIYCPPNTYNPKFKLTIRSGSNVQIECNLTDASEYKSLPKLSIGQIDGVQIQRCPLPGYTPIAGILDHLGIESPKMLIFESNNLGVNLTRKHLDRLHNLKRLRFTSRRLTYIPFDFLSDLRNLSWLDLRSNIVELPAHLFDNLTSLEFLELGSNNLQQLPHGLFRNLHKLQHLNLWSNQLRNLTRHDFEGAASVLDVDLSANGIEHLPRDVFAQFTELNVINLSANRFHSLPEGLFEHNKKLKQVRLLNNRVSMPTLPPRLFANLPELHTLSLRSDLETLPADLLDHSTQLVNLSLTNNYLNMLPAGLFKHQVNMLSLNLRRNRLTHLPDMLFDHTENLVDLNLADNLLTEISKDLFGKLTRLERLTLNNNQLKIVHPEAFAATTQLRFINLENNMIDLMGGDMQSETATPFSHLEQLEVLNLRNNSIMFIYNDWKYNLLSLQELDLAYNKLSLLDYTDLQFLSRRDVSINITHNQLHSINFFANLDVSPTNTVVSVDLNDNPLSCDCGLMRFVQFIRRDINPDYRNQIDLQTEQLKCAGPSALADRFVGDVDPRELLCPFDQSVDPRERRCPLGCDCMVRTFDKALIVNCSFGNLSAMPQLPELPPSLHIMELYLENNSLQQLPAGNKSGYANVTHLYLAGNSLSEVEVHQLPSHLRKLDLRNNRLRSLNSGVLEFLNRTMTKKSLYLSNNPWVCNCTAKELLIFTQNNYDRIADRSDMLCVDAEQPTPMEDLSVNDICSESQRVVYALIIVVALTAFLVSLTAAFYYKYELEIKIWLYAHNLCMWFVTEEEVDKNKKFDAFISFSQKDYSFVENHLVPQLEHGPIKFQLCVHDRDWKVGCFIPENIVRSVSDSRRTIIVLSHNFIQSEWAKLEFRAAHRSALNEGRSRVIVIIYSDIGDVEKLDDELKAYLKMNTYLKWGDPLFWDKLRYAMPHRAPYRNGVLAKSKLMGSTDDSLQLTKSSPGTPPLTTPPAEATKNPLVAQLNGGTAHTAIMIANGRNALTNLYAPNGRTHGNGHINGAFIINTNARQSDV